jgi:hypothetical protein
MTNAEQTTYVRPFPTFPFADDALFLPRNAAAPTDAPNSDAPQTPPVEDKGKGKIVSTEDVMEEDDDEEDEEGEEEEEEVEDDDMDEVSRHVSRSFDVCDALFACLGVQLAFV